MLFIDHGRGNRVLELEAGDLLQIAADAARSRRTARAGRGSFCGAVRQPAERPRSGGEENVSCENRGFHGERKNSTRPSISAAAPLLSASRSAKNTKRRQTRLKARAAARASSPYISMQISELRLHPVAIADASVAQFLWPARALRAAHHRGAEDHGRADRHQRNLWRRRARRGAGSRARARRGHGSVRAHAVLAIPEPRCRAAPLGRPQPNVCWFRARIRSISTPERLRRSKWPAWT